ncbi:MAG TPA: hypothetical protein GXZ87_05585 [Bacteroidales bacterium]|nr:hypothetical protein [Bacteroidales bacterium]
MNLVLTIIVPLVIVLIAVFLLGFKMFLFKDGKFPNTHVGGNKALRDKGIGCATTQDRNARKEKPKIDISNLINEIEK